MKRSVKDWYEIVQENDDDRLARIALGSLAHYVLNRENEKRDIQQLVALITAIRLHQMAKENSA